MLRPRRLATGGGGGGIGSGGGAGRDRLREGAIARALALRFWLGFGFWGAGFEGGFEGGFAFGGRPLGLGAGLATTIITSGSLPELALHAHCGRPKLDMTSFKAYTMVPWWRRVLDARAARTARARASRDASKYASMARMHSVMPFGHWPFRSTYARRVRNLCYTQVRRNCSISRCYGKTDHSSESVPLPSVRAGIISYRV